MKKAFKVIYSIPKRILKRIFGLPLGLRIINFIFQKIFRMNSQVPFQVHYTTQVIGSDIIIHSNVWKSFALSGNCYIQAGNGIEIGENTIFAPGVKIISANHDLANLKEWKKARSIRIGKNCWIGANAIILPEVVLEDNVVVGAGSLVTKSFPSNSVIVGNPAKIIKTLT